MPGDIAAMTLPAGAYDAITSISALHHMGDQDDAVLRAGRARGVVQGAFAELAERQPDLLAQLADARS